MKKGVFWDVAPYLHGATSQKTAFFIVTAVKTSNLTQTRKFWNKWEEALTHCKIFHNE
jgi:hypothetical protein